MKASLCGFHLRRCGQDQGWACWQRSLLGLPAAPHFTARDDGLHLTTP